MRLILFFDLPVEKSAQRKAYRHFIKDIKTFGFYMVQKSVYVKMSIDMQAVNSTIEKIKKISPKEGNISVLSITEKQFAGIEYILGENKTDVINSDNRIIELWKLWK